LYPVLSREAKYTVYGRSCRSDRFSLRRIHYIVKISRAFNTFIQLLSFTLGTFKAANPALLVAHFHLDTLDIFNWNSACSPIAWTLPGSPSANNTLYANGSRMFSFDFASTDPARFPNARIGRSSGPSMLKVQEEFLLHFFLSSIG
jgi:hypothetical protein